MNNTRSVTVRTLLLTAGAAAALLGVLRLADQYNNAYNGYVTDGNNTVIRVDRGSPAEQAGLRAGDYIRSIDGIPVEDARALSQRDRPQIGGICKLVVERRGGSAGASQPVREVTFAYAPSPFRNRALGYAGFLIGLCFLACGLTAGLRIPTRSGSLFAATGLCFGAAFLGTPYFSSYAVRSLALALLNVVVVFGFAFLFHLMLEFPKPKVFLRRRHALMVLYGPALLVALYAMFLIVIRPPATSGLNRTTTLLFGFFLVAYFGGAAAAIIHSYAKATAQERSQQGLHVMMGGILLGILPLTLALILRMFVPMLVLAGSDFFFITMIAIPISLYAAISRRERAKVPEALAAHV